MEDQVERLVKKAWKRYEETPLDRRLLIGIAGIPGSGKTTLSQIITTHLNTLAALASPNSPPPATYVPMDGYHLTRATLSAMPNPTHAHARRGASFTFDAPKFLALVQALRQAPSDTILAPSFDHAVKDPKEADIAILPSHRVVVLEGNYLALDKEVWRDAAALLDELWFVEVDFEVARVRLRERHVRAGIAKDVEEGDRRAMENDLVNGEEVVANRLKVDEVVKSRDDGGWVHQ
ncbi:Fc.00g097600.m01.CDS01 [Cosmosporella sp. VM-42]